MLLNLAVNLLPFNDGPSIEVADGETSDGTPVTSTVDENTVGALLGRITATDPDQSITAANITTSDPRFVVVTDSQGNLWLALAAGVSLDYETEPSVDVKLTVTDDAGATAQTTVTITVHDINEAPSAPSLTAAASNLMVEENTPYGMNLALLSSEDPEGSPVTYTVDNDDFEIEVIGTVAILKLKNDVEPDREATENGTISFNVTAADSDGNVSAPTQVVVTIVDVNEAPIGQDSTGAVTAGSKTPAIGNVNATDDDEDTLSFSVDSAPTYGTLNISTNGAWTYTLDQSDAAVIALRDGATLEDTASIEINDNSGGTDMVDVTITITGANQNPTGENTTGAVTIGDARATGNVNAADVDQGDILSFAVGTSPSYGRLTIARDGVWTYRLDQTDSAVVALGKDTSLEDTATIVITDSAGGTASVNVTITITGVNEAPTAQDSSGTVTAGAAAAVGNVNATDADSGDSLSYAVTTQATYGTLSVGSGGVWSYSVDNSNAAVIALAQGATLNDAATITVTDTSGATATADVSITINGVNETPTAADASGAVLKGDATPDTGSIQASDVDTGDSLTYALGTAPQYGTLEVDASGNWTYTLDEENTSVVDLADDATLSDEGTITVTDSSGSAATVTLSITVYATNADPTISVADGTTSDGTQANSTVNENAPGLALGIIDASDPNQTLDASNVSTSDARFVVKTDSDDGLYLALADDASLDFESEPTVDVTVTVTDDLDATATHTLTITVTDQNDAPDAPIVTPASSNFRVTENDTSGPNLADLQSSDPEGDSITYVVDHKDFEIEQIGRAFLLKVKDGVGLDREATEDGTITIMVTASDGKDTSVATPVVITVLDVNEDPSISVADGTTPDGVAARSTINENLTGPVGAITATDPEQSFTKDDITLSDDRFSVTQDANGGLWLVLDEGIDAETEQSVTLTLEVMDDGGLKASTQVTINVVEINEAPTLTVTDATRLDGTRARSLISENDTGPVGLITIADEEDDLDAGDISLSSTRFTTETDARGSVWLLLNEAANFESDGATLSVTLIVTDSEGLSTPVVFDLDIVDVNEAPTISVKDGELPNGVAARSTIVENTTGPVGAITLSDPEQTLGKDDITISDARFSVIEDAFGGLWLTLNEAIDADVEESLKVTLSLVDSGGLPASADVTISIVGVNEVPTVTVTDATRSDGVRARPVIDENKTGPVGLITLGDPEETLDASNITLSDATRFATETDAEGRIWLMLNQAADYETDGSSLSVTVTVTDSQGLPATADVKVRIIDDNDPPQALQTGVQVITQEATDKLPKKVENMIDLFATAGADETRIKMDLKAMFSDQDGDSIFAYTLENSPAWLQLLNVQYGTDGSVTGELVGKVPAGSDTSAMNIKLVASDQGGASGSTTFNVIVDDGNDEITEINLLNADGTTNAFKTVDVAENDSSGVVIGKLTAEDLDNARHPNGQHTFEVAPAYQDQFETVQQGGDWVLKLKQGVALDYESASTIGLEVIAKDGGGSSLTRVISLNVTDNNDAPTVKNQPGNWWVTVDEDLDADDVLAGDWLTFSLETGTDALALFEDVDVDDDLTYSIVSGPSWLEINADTGQFKNKAGTLPTRGIYNVTVRATDEDKTSAQASFKIAVVLSDANNADNSEPDIKTNGIDIKETAKAGTVVGRITIEDEDLDLAGLHPWSDLTVVVEATAKVGIANTTNDVVIQSAADFMDDDATNDFFALKKVSQDRDSITYDIVLTENAFKGANAINAESYDEVEIVVTAYDGTVTVDFASIDRNTDGADIDDFDFDIDDVNEAPALVETELDAAHTSDALAKVDDAYVYPVGQQQAADSGSGVHTIYLNLTKLFEDPDDDHDDGDFTFTASVSSTSWLKMARLWNEDSEKYTTGPAKWEDIKDGVDESPGGGDDLEWLSSGTTDDPEDDDYVLILEVDRTGSDGTGANATPDASEIRQDNDGRITIIATDEDGARSTTAIDVTITDENLNPRADGSTVVGVRISDTTPTEKQTITISFDDSVDPDFNGADADSDNPVAVIYQVINVAGGGSGTETIVQASVGNSASYTVVQGDVGDEIQGKVVYYELFEGSIVPSQTDNEALETNSSLVKDRQDPASIDFTFETNNSDQLVAKTTPQDDWDPDGLATAPEITYTWEYSANGRGGWKVFDGNGSSTKPDTGEATIPSSVAGNYVRLVISFEDANGVSELVASDAVKVGTIDTVDSTSVPDINAGGSSSGLPVGRTLRIDLTKAIPTKGSAKAEWLADDVSTTADEAKLLGTGTQYRITEADRGMSITVRITSLDKDGNITSIVETDAVTTVAAPANSGPVAPKANFIVDLGAAPAEEGDLETHTATVRMANLFEDIEGGLTYGFAAPGSFELDSVGGEASLDVYYDGNTTSAGDGDQLLIIDEATGAVSYYTTMSHGHDEDGADGAGNLVTSVLTATDAAANDATARVNVQFRIDVAPTGFEVGTDPSANPDTDATAAPTKPYDFEATGATLTEDITVAANDQGTQTNQQTAARIDVQDENMGSHNYGKYTFTADDPRFEVIVDDADGSLATLRLKTGQSLDFEKITGPANQGDTKSILVVVTATPVNKNFDPITLGITVNVSNNTSDDPDDPVNLGNNKVPGLKDNEGSSNDDDTKDDDDGTDTDDDGGTPIPMNALTGYFSLLDDGIF